MILDLAQSRFILISEKLFSNKFKVCLNCNILLNKDEIRLADFGTSKQTKNTMTNTSVKGTGYYMSPELLEI